MNVVITGGAGYLGSVVTAHLLQAGHRVTVLDALTAGGESLLAFAPHPCFRLVASDVRDRSDVRRAISGADVVVHAAAAVGEPVCSTDAEAARSINVGGTSTVAAATEEAGVGRLVLISTCSNYGVSGPDAPADEDSPLRPLGVYANSKVEAERAALTGEARTSRLVLRLGTICGLSPRMRFDLLVNDMARRAALGERIDVFCPEAWRPSLHIRDAARAVEWALTASGSQGDRVFNVVGENRRKKDLVELVRRHFPEALVEITPGATDPRDYRVSAGRIEREGFSPAHTVEGAFVETADAVRAGMFRGARRNDHAAAPIPRSAPRDQR